MTVVDASVVVRLLFARPDDDDLRAIFSEPGDELVAPDHIDAEVLSAVIGLLKGNHLERERATTMIRRFAALPIRRYRTLSLATRIVELRHNFTAYDGAYVALAEVLEEPLLTADLKFARAPAPAHKATIRTIRS